MLNKMIMLQQLLNDKKGQGMVEYGLILALVAIVAIGSLKLMGTDIGAMFSTISSSIK